MRGAWGIDFRGYLGCRDNRRVLGRWKETEVRTLRILLPEVPLRAAFLAAAALMASGFAFALPAAARNPRGRERTSVSTFTFEKLLTDVLDASKENSVHSSRRDDGMRSKCAVLSPPPCSSSCSSRMDDSVRPPLLARSPLTKFSLLCSLFSALLLTLTLTIGGSLVSRRHGLDEVLDVR